MAYIAPIHRPSSVRHALKLRLLTPDDECLVVAKASRLEIYNQTPEGLSLQHSKAIYGRVTVLNRIRPASSITDHLFVGTDRFTYFTLSWDPSTKQLKTEKSYVDLADKTARESQTGDRCLVDPSGRFMTLEMFEGIITTIPIQHKGKKKQEPADLGNLGEPIPSRIPELFVRSSVLLAPRSDSDKPRIALLYEDNHNKVRLKIRQLVYTPGSAGEAGSVEFEDAEGTNEVLELGASHVLLVPRGLLIIGETSMTYYDEASNETTTQPLDEATIFVAWTQIDEQRFVLADEYGRLYLLMLVLDGRQRAVADWKMEQIGQTSRASTLVYLDAGHIFLGSHQGDSQVIRIQEGGMEVVQTFSNIAPVLDFTIMDMASRAAEGQTNEFSSGQARIVTGSGAWNDGSLRSVRSGVGLEELGLLGGDMQHVTNMFSLKSHPSVEFFDTLVVTFINESRIFRFSSDGEVEEVSDYIGFSLLEQTLLASNLSNGQLLQVTTSTIRVTDPESGMVVSEWEPEHGASINSVAVEEYQVILSYGGGQLAVFDVSDTIRVQAQKDLTSKGQIACVTLSKLVPHVCLVGFWETSSISILHLDSLATIQDITLTQENVIPRSLLITRIFLSSAPVLFIAMADGTVITYSIDPSTYALSSKKSIILGTQQASFRTIPRNDELFSVFATCEHPSLIYGEEGRLVYSAVTAEKATCVCPFDAEAYPGAIAIATKDDVRIGLVDTERTTHVQTLGVGETVRRVAYSPSLKAFGLGTIKRILAEGQEIVASHFKLVDEIAFHELDTYELNPDELVESVIRCELNDGSNTNTVAERFIVGTAYLEDDAGDAVRGRILVFEVTQDRLLKKVTETSVKGACRCLGIVDGKIVAALMKTVVVFGFDYITPSRPQLTKRATYRTSTAPIDMAITGSTIAVVDLMKSLSIVQYRPGKAGDKGDVLEEVARHFQTVWGTAVAQVAEGTWVESDAEGNLIVLNREDTGVTEEDRRRLKVSSEMRLGEMVNRIRPIDVAVQPDAAVIPKAFLATVSPTLILRDASPADSPTHDRQLTEVLQVEGSIYLFALIPPTHQNTLMQLQSNLAELVQSPGHVPFNSYRAFRNHVRESEEPYRFVDGELVERFLDLDAGVQESLVEGLGVGAEEVRGLVEGLRRLR